MNGNELFEPISNKNHNSDLPILAITQEQGAVPRELINYNVSVSAKSVESYKVVEVGDFIISLRSFQGGIEYSNYLGLCSPAYIILRKKRDLLRDFYRHYFKSFLFIQDLNRNLEGIRDGKMISYKQFSEILIPNPKKEEQQKIAFCLSSLDELITAHNDKLVTLKDYKKGLMQKLFPQEGETVPKIRFSEFEKDGEWVEIALKQVVPQDEKYGIVDGPFGSNLKTIHYKKEGIPIITSGYVTDGYFLAKDYTYVTPEKFKKEKRSSVKGGDIVMAKIGARCGASAIMPFNHQKGILSGNALKITVDENRFSTNFIWQQLWFHHQSKKLNTIKKIGAQPAISISNLKEYCLVIPKHPEEQQKIASCLSAVDELINAQAEKIEQLQQHKKGLMQGLFPKIES